MIDYHRLSTRAGRYDRIRAFLPDPMGAVAAVIAAMTLAVGTRFAGPVTEALGWVTP